MNNINSKVTYFARSLRKRLNSYESKCPGCGQAGGAIGDRKAWVTTLVECHHCGLLYRTPTDSEKDSYKFYQDGYAEGYVTELPGDGALNKLLSNNFAGSPHDYSKYLEVLRRLEPSGSRILEYGSSWGYGAYQLARAGYEVEAFDVARARCNYAAEKLKIKATSEWAEVGDGFDVFFSAHVLEHVPNLQETIRRAKMVTKPGGLFVAFTPNGSNAYRSANPEAFRKSWGLAHPNVLQDKFYRRVFREHAIFLATAPYPLDEISSWNRAEQKVSDLTGWELLAVVVL